MGSSVSLNPSSKNCFPAEVYSALSQLPQKSDEAFPGIPWGCYSQLFTPSFWKIQYVFYQCENVESNFRLGNTLLEEIVACMLGGFGLPAEVGLLAFQRLKDLDLIRHGATFQEIHAALSAPMIRRDGTSVTYRFYNQKSKYLSSLLSRSDLVMIYAYDDLALRTWLLSNPGIGLKTSSWIVRNWFASDNVAILDIHILRAGILLGLFEKDLDVSREYLVLEHKYLDFCRGIDVSAAGLDAVIWDFMKKSNRFVLKLLNS